MWLTSTSQRWTVIASSVALLCCGGPCGAIADDVVASYANVTVKWVDHPLVLSSIGPDNPLPAFFFSRTQVRQAACPLIAIPAV